MANVLQKGPKVGLCQSNRGSVIERVQQEDRFLREILVDDEMDFAGSIVDQRKRA
ncbi:hypothetical protein ACEQUB_p00101 (plasmid) [Ralstonia syzygii]